MFIQISFVLRTKVLTVEKEKLLVYCATIYSKSGVNQDFFYFNDSCFFTNTELVNLQWSLVICKIILLKHIAHTSTLKLTWKRCLSYWSTLSVFFFFFWRPDIPTINWNSHGYQLRSVISKSIFIFTWNRICARSNAWKEDNTCCGLQLNI